MNDKLVSIIVPVYNAEKYIERCLKSIINNTYSNLEIICVNDGSKDNSLTILERYQEFDSRVIVITQENKGVSAARNAGLNAAKGEFISFIDADDWVHRQYIEFLLYAIKNADISHCDMLRANGNESISIEETPSIELITPADKRAEKITNHCCGKLFRIECINEQRFKENIAFGEDKLFTTLVIQNAQKIAVLSAPLYFYFCNPTSAVNTIEQNLYLPAVSFLEDANIKGHPLSLQYAYTGFLSYRYITMFRPNAKQIRKNCNTKLKECKIAARRILPIRKRLLLNTFAHFGILYRMYRILIDRTMLDWEKNQKKQKIGETIE